MDDLDFFEDDDQDEIEDLDFPIDPYDDILIDNTECLDDSNDCVLDQEFIDNHLNIVPSEVLHNFPFVEDDVDAITDYELFSKGFGYLDEKKVNKDELSDVAYTGDYDDLYNKPDIPDMSEYVKKDTTELENYPLTSSLSNVATTGNYNDLSNKPTIPDSTSDLTNDSGFITNTVNNLTNYPLTSSLSSVAFSGDYDDLSDKPTIPTVPTNVSSFTNDSGYITKNVNDLTNYTLTSNLSTVATTGNYNDLSNKPTIPDSTSDLTNDSGFITNSVNDLTNYTDTSTLTSLLAGKENTMISGSNANGYYIKLDDGTMIQWGIIDKTNFSTSTALSTSIQGLNIYRSNTTNVSLPQSFLNSSYTLMLYPRNGTSGCRFISSRIHDKGVAIFIPQLIGLEDFTTSGVGYTNLIDVEWIAIGKWK